MSFGNLGLDPLRLTTQVIVQNREGLWGVGKDCRRWGGAQTAGIRTDGRAHVEKNEGDCRGWLRMAGGCRRAMSDIW